MVGVSGVSVGSHGEEGGGGGMHSLSCMGVVVSGGGVVEKGRVGGAGAGDEGTGGDGRAGGGRSTKIPV